MLKTIILLAIVSMCALADDEEKVEDLKKDGERDKRLLFFDENGDLIKTYSTNKRPYPFLNYFGLLNTVQSSNSNSGNKPIQYMIPISDQMTQDIAYDPIYQNKLILLPSRQSMVSVGKNTLCNGKREQIPSPMSCSNFLNCWDGWAFEQECPQGLLFSSEGYCDYPYNVNCNERFVVPDSKGKPKCENEFQAYRDQHKCNEFYICVNRSPISFKCPDGLVFNQEIGVCDYGFRVNCNNMAIEASTEKLKPMADEEAPPPKVEAAAADPPPSIKMFFNSQGWSSSHVATSRLDALRQMQLKKLANVESQ